MDYSQLKCKNCGRVNKEHVFSRGSVRCANNRSQWEPREEDMQAWTAEFERETGAKLDG